MNMESVFAGETKHQNSNQTKKKQKTKQKQKKGCSYARSSVLFTEHTNQKEGCSFLQPNEGFFGKFVTNGN